MGRQFVGLSSPNTYPIQFITSPVGEFQFSEQHNLLHKIKPGIKFNIITLYSKLTFVQTKNKDGIKELFDVLVEN